MRICVTWEGARGFTTGLREPVNVVCLGVDYEVGCGLKDGGPAKIGSATTTETSAT